MVARLARKGMPKRRLLDEMCITILERCPNAVVPWWLIASYLYYHHDLSILSDSFYDGLAEHMLDNWDEIKHQNKYLITKEDLKTGSLFALKEEDYPFLTKDSATFLVRREWGIDLRQV